jgi:hypothetical protein
MLWRAMPKWRNWQTRTTQNRVPVRVCGFDSHLRHHAFRNRVNLLRVLPEVEDSPDMLLGLGAAVDQLVARFEAAENGPYTAQQATVTIGTAPAPGAA